MIFNKTETPSSSTSADIAIIGTSASAFFLADTLQNSGCQVTVLVPPHQLESYNKRGAFCIKQSRFQNKHTHFTFASVAAKPYDFCFLASTPAQTSSDLLCLNQPYLHIVPVINLSFLYNRNLLNKLNTVKIIPAVFKAQLSLNKNTVELYEHSPKLEIITSGENAVRLKNIFNDSSIDLNILPSDKRFFWQNLAPYFIGNLLLLCYNKPISALMSQAETRHQADSAVNELISLAATDKISLDSGEIIARIYTFANDYPGDIKTQNDFNAFLNLIKELNRFDTPVLFDLLSLASKKY